MFRISKLSLSTKTNLELFRTVQNYNDHSIEVVDIINLTIICHQISRFMGRLSKMDSVYEDPPKKQSRKAGAKKYNKQTVFKLFSHLKTTNIVVQGTGIELRVVNWKQYEHLSFKKNYPENVQFYVQTPWIRVLMT